MKHFREWRYGAQIPVIDGSIESSTDKESLEGLKRFLEVQALPVWVMSLRPHLGYFTLKSVQGPFEVREAEPSEFYEELAAEFRSMGDEKSALWALRQKASHLLEGRLARQDEYQLCHRERNPVFSVWPSESQTGSQTLLSPGDTVTFSSVVGEKNIAEQLSVLGVQDPRVEKLSAAELEKNADELFAQRNYEIEMGRTRTLSQMEFVDHAIRTLGLTGRDALRCLHTLFKKWGRQFTASNILPDILYEAG